MKQSMRQEIEELAEEAFEEIISRDYDEELRAITDSWNAPFLMVENMFAEILGKILIGYSRK